MASGLDIAVIGMAGRFPGARSVDEFWRNLTSGTESISFFSTDEVLASGVDPALAGDPRYVKAGGVLDDAELFDAAFFGYTPREAEVMDPQQRVFLECAWEAFEHAGYDTSRYRKPVGVYAGMSMNSYVLSNLVHNPAAVEAIGEAQAAIANLHDHLATRVSYKLDLRGPSFTVQTACSTSLVAVHLACQGLISGECDMALAGGVSIGIPQKAGYLYQEGGTHSPDGHCRAFDAAAQGMIGGHGVGTVVLKRLEDAQADGDRIWAVIKGTAINNDGASKVGYTAPSVEGQARVIRDALQVAGVTADSVSYVETHGTGTPIGDPIEFEALTRVFKTPGARTGSCGLGAVKTNVGHLDAAAGVTGLIKTVLALHHRLIPPTLHFEQPNPRIDLASSPFFIVDTLKEWTTNGDARRAGVSSFGIGGTNAHVVLEEAPARSLTPHDAPRTSHLAPQLFVLSARTATALDAAQARLTAHLNEHPEESQADIAWTLQVGRRAWPHRLAVVGRVFDRAVRGDAQAARQTAFLLPGQGAQYPGMARELYARFAGFREPFDRCANAMRAGLDVDLLSLVASADAERLARTEYAQPALFAVEYALAEWLISLGIKPAASLGHSIGEYVAACLAGVFTLADAAALVVARGRLMSEAPNGAMTAVPLSEADAAGWTTDQISIAAINGPAACVLAGPLDAMTALEARLTAGAIGFTRLRTSHAFHSSLMDGIVDRFAEMVSRVTLAPPRTPFISNVTGRWIDPAEAVDPRYWARHLREPVRFADGIATLASTCTRLIEVGPGTALSGLARQTLRGHDVSVMTTLPRADEGTAADETCLAAIGRCWVEGMEIDWRGLHDASQRTRVALPAYPFERQRHWIDPLPRDSHARGGSRARHGIEFHVPAWKRRPSGLPLSADDAPKRWLVIADAHGLGREIAERLRSEQGARAPRASDVVLAEAGATPALAGFDVIVYCRAASPAAADLASTQERAFDGLVSIAKALGQQRVFSPVRLEVISSNLHDVAGTEALEPLKALLTGPLRVIPQEYPNVRSRNIDIDWPAGVDASAYADRVVAELRTSPDAQMVALRGAGRWILGYDAVDLPAAPPAVPIRDGDTWVVAGGFGTIGLAAARALASQARVNIVLLGRHARQDHAAVAELTGMGAEVLTIVCDIEDATAINGALQQTRERFGSITGIVHAAGPSGGSTLCALADMDAAHIADQFGAKVRGLLALRDAMAAHPGTAPATICLTSSLSSPLGGLGFGAYAAANAVMDAIATQASRDGATRWISIDWDGWRVEREGLSRANDGSAAADAISAREGQQAFAALLQHNAGPQLLAVVGDLHPRLARWINPGTRTERRSAKAPAGSGPITEANNDVERLVISAWDELLGVNAIGLDDNFFDLGGHSLLATQLVSRLRRTFLIDVPLRVIFDQPTPRAIAAAIVLNEPKPGQAMATAEIRMRLGSMTADEAKAMLAARQAAVKSGATQ